MKQDERKVLTSKDIEKLTGEHIIISNGFTEIGRGEFSYNRRETIKSITLPASMTKLDDSSFEFFTKLENIFVDKDNPVYMDIDGVVFTKDKKAIVKHPQDKPYDWYDIPDGVTTISGGAFAGSAMLRHIIIPDSVTKIEHWAFRGCEELRDMIIPDNVKEIGALAFCECSKLEVIRIPESTDLPSKTFLHCHALINIAVSKNDKEPKFLSEIDLVLFNYDKTVLIDYPIGRWDSEYIIPDGVKHISRGTFEEAGFLKKITIPDSVKSIDHNAFNNCWSLESVNIPSGLTAIEDFSFYSCEKLKNVVIPYGITVLGYQVFSGCSSLTEIVIPESVNWIKSGAFSACWNLERITIPDSVVVIDELALSSHRPEGCKKTVIRCRENSAAHRYALKNDYDFELIGE